MVILSYEAAAVVLALLCTRLLAAPPNVVLIIADDQGYGDCSAYPRHAGNIQTPNIDRIAHAGAIFTDGYVTASVCSPSRTQLFNLKSDPQEQHDLSKERPEILSKITALCTHWLQCFGELSDLSK